jgi:hypothetical protein
MFPSELIFALDDYAPEKIGAPTLRKFLNIAHLLDADAAIVSHNDFLGGEWPASIEPLVEPIVSPLERIPEDPANRAWAVEPAVLFEAGARRVYEQLHMGDIEVTYQMLENIGNTSTYINRWPPRTMFDIRKEDRLIAIYNRAGAGARSVNEFVEERDADPDAFADRLIIGMALLRDYDVRSETTRLKVPWTGSRESFKRVIDSAHAFGHAVVLAGGPFEEDWSLVTDRLRDGLEDGLDGAAIGRGITAHPILGAINALRAAHLIHPAIAAFEEARAFAIMQEVQSLRATVAMPDVAAYYQKMLRRN